MSFKDNAFKGREGHLEVSSGTYTGGGVFWSRADGSQIEITFDSLATKVITLNTGEAYQGYPSTDHKSITIISGVFNVG